MSFGEAVVPLGNLKFSFNKIGRLNHLEDIQNPSPASRNSASAQLCSGLIFTFLRHDDTFANRAVASSLPVASQDHISAPL